MALRDVTYIQKLLTTLNVFVFVAQNCVSPFFPLYLKYLGLTVLEMSLIRAFQIILTIMVIPFSIYVMKQNCLRKWRTQFVVLSILASFCACVMSAIYFQSGNKVNLMHCGSVGGQLTLATLNVHNFSEQDMMTNMVTVATSDTEINSTENNFGSVSFSDVSNSNPSHIPVFQMPEIFKEHTKNFEFNSSTQFATIKYSTRTDKLSSTQYFEKLSSSPEITSASPKIITELYHLRETQADGNIEDIFSAGEQSTSQQVSNHLYQESYSDTESQGYVPVVKHGQRFKLKNKTDTVLIHTYNLTSKQSNDLPLFSKNYTQKHVQATENTNVVHQSQNLKVPVQAFFPLLNTARRKNSIKPLRGTNFDYLAKLPYISTTRNNINNYYTTPSLTVRHTSYGLAMDNFKEIMDFVYHHKTSTNENHGSGLNKLTTSENNAIYRDNYLNSENENRHMTKHKKQQYPKYNTYSSDQSRNLNFRNIIPGKSATSIYQLLERVKRMASEVDNLKVAKKMSVLEREYVRNQSDVISGTTSRVPHSTEYTNEAIGHDDVAAMAMWSWGRYWDVSQVFVEAVMLAAVYEVSTNTALPCVWELWVQVSGRRLDTRGPLQLGVWSGCLCLVLVVAVIQPCQLRATVHWGSSAAAWAMALCPVLVAVPPIARRARPNKLPSNADDTAATASAPQALVHSASELVSGFLAACSSEFLLWHVATLGGSPLDRELLYCGYLSLSSLVEAGVRAYCRGAGESARSAGFTLLGAHFLGAGLLGQAWAFLVVAPLGGAGWALTWPAEPVWGWSLGYGLGCLAGGLTAHFLSTASLFVSSAAVSCVFAVICQR